MEDTEFINAFKKSSAAKTVHHGFVGGLLQHTLSVVKLCDYYCTAYERLNKDLLITAAICHDIGKIKEISPFPQNDYTDAGQLLGHIYIGAHLVENSCDKIEGFPERLKRELVHCILAHHGELEYGSPKKPALVEAFALNFADNADAKFQTLIELMSGDEENLDWLGFQRTLDTNLRRTGK